MVEKVTQVGQVKPVSMLLIDPSEQRAWLNYT